MDVFQDKEINNEIDAIKSSENEEKFTKEDLEMLKGEYEIKLEEVKDKEEKLLKRESLLKKRKESLRKREEEYEEELETLEEERIKFKEEKINFAKELEEKTNADIQKVIDRNKELSQIANKNKILEGENENLKDKIEKFEEYLDECKGKLRASNLKISEYESNYDIEEIKKLKEYKQSISEKDSEIRELKVKLDYLNKNNLDLHSKIEDLALVEDNNSILTNKLDRCRAQIRYIKRIEEAKGSGEDSSQGIFEEIIVNQKSKDEIESKVNYSGDEKFIDDFVKFCKECGFIYSKTVARNFLASLRSSKMTILKGYSGTGKSSLPNLFANFIKGECVIVPVQPNWRTKQDIVGFYNYFTNKFIPTDLTKALIRANVSKDRIFIIVLDEMNLARVEYYFSEFNSKLWLSKKEREIELFEGTVEYDGIVSEYIKNNKIKIPDNVYFVGTINEDDSVSAISDKIFDRAQVVEFLELPKSDKVGDIEKAKFIRNGEFTRYSTFVKEDCDSGSFSINIIDKVNEFLKDNFNKVIGFRSLKQAKLFVNSYVQAGGKREEAIDLQLVSKFMPKLKFIYSDEQIDALEILIEEIKELYKEEFNMDYETLDNLKIIQGIEAAIKELREQ